MLARVLAAPPPSVASVQPGLPADLVAIVDKAMARAPSDRYPTAIELALDLRKFQTGQLVGAHRYSTWQLVRRWLRRHRAAVTVAAVLLVLSGAGAAVAVDKIIDERDVAQAERARADANRDEADVRRRAAEGLGGYMLTTLKDKLETLGKLDMLADVGSTVLAYYRAVPIGVEDVDALFSRANALMVLGDVTLHKGDIPGARALYTEAQGSVAELVRRKPDNLKALEARGRSLEKLADVESSAGTLETARARYEESKAAFTRCHELAPAVGGYKQAVAVTQFKLADLDTREGKLDAAAAGFHAAQVALQAAAAEAPKDTELQRRLNVIARKYADVLDRSGKVDEAYAVLSAADATATALVANDPSNTELAESVAIERFTIGDIERERLNIDAAADWTLRANAALVTLAAHDPANLQWQEFLLVGYGRVGDVEKLRDHADQSIGAYRAALALARRLALHDPTSARAKSDVAYDLRQVALGEQAAGDLTAARRDFTEAEGLLEGLVAADGKDLEARQNLASTESDIGTILAATHAPGALDRFRRAIALDEQMLHDAPDDSTVPHNLALDHDNLVRALRADGQATAALAEQRTALAFASRAAAAAPANVPFQISLGTELGTTAEVVWPIDHVEARQLLTQAIDMLTKLGPKLSGEDRVRLAALERERADWR